MNVVLWKRRSESEELDLSLWQDVEEDRCVAAVKEDRLTSIRVRFLSPKQCQKFFKYAKKSKKLLTIEAIGACISTSCAESIAELLSENATLTYLGLIKVKIEPPGLNLLTDHLKRNKALLTLIMRDTLAESAEMGQFAHNIASALSLHTRLTRLEISGYRLNDDAVASISSALTRNKSLTALDLSQNPITENGVLNLCRGLKDNTTLETLALQNIVLPAGPTAFQYFHKTLTTYSLKLSHLSLNGNQVELRGLGFLTRTIEASKLHSLQLSKCKLSTTDANCLFTLINQGYPLRKLWLCDNYVTSLVGLSLESARACSELHLAGNALADGDLLRRLCIALRLNRKLSCLDLARCGLGDAARSEFAQALAQNYSLTRLHLSDGDDGLAIPATILNRNTRLKQLLSERARNKQVPVRIDNTLAFALSPLELFLCSLELSNQQLSESVFALCRAQGGTLSAVQRALLYRNRLTEFPLRTLLFTGTMRALVELDLSFNQIKTVPEEIHQLSALTKLYLHSNSIEVLPLHMSQMPSLTSLCITDNRLNSLPTFLMRSRKLTEVLLTGNPWRFPANLLASQWGSRRLDLRMQRLKALPMEIFDMTHLTELLLSNNDLSGLPQEIESLTNLKLLDLFDNPQLRVLPWQLGRLTSLTDVRLNSSNSLPVEVCNLSTPDLLKHTLSLRNGASPCYRYRLMLVGQDNVGKTCLAQAMKDVLLPLRAVSSGRKKSATAPAPLSSPSVPLVPGRRDSISKEKERMPFLDLSTDGLATNEITAQVDGQTYMYSLWDFAGQDVYLPTHNFFLTPTAIYLLAFDMSKPLEESYRSLDYWTRLMRTVAPKAPIILVGTHADARQCTPEYTASVLSQLNARYHYLSLNIAGFVDVSGKTRKNVSALIQAIEGCAKKDAELLGTGEVVPHLYWLLEHQLRQAALAMPVPIVNVEQFNEIAVRCGLTEPKDWACALRKFTQLGIVVSFRRERSIRAQATLAQIVVLDPFWLADMFKSIITTKQNFVENGVLLHKNATLLWKDKASADLYLDMLQKFEVLHPFLQGYRDEPFAAPAEPSSIVPFLLPLLPPDLPQIGWRPPPVTYNRLFELPFVPAGLFGRVMAAAIRVAHPVHYWRDGIILSRYKGACMALMSCTATDAVGSASNAFIRLSVYGDEGAAILLADLTHVIIARLTEADLDRGVRVQILCNCAACGSSVSAKAFRWPAMRVVKATSVVCGESKVEIPTHRLAPDLSVERFSGLRIGPGVLSEMGEQIGKGSFGIVWRATLKSATGALVPVAVKGFAAIPEHELELLQIFSSLWREADVWQRLSHPNLARLLGVVPVLNNETAGLQFVSELLLPCTPLHRFLYPQRPVLAPDLRLRIATDVARGLEYMHSLNPPVMHRDFKSPNILVVSENAAAKVVAKIIDFGTGFQGFCASDRVVDNPTWLAVEVMREEVYGPKVDIYGFGVVLWELWAQAVPFEEYHFSFNAHLELAVLRGVRPSIPASCPDAFARLIEDCWSPDPSIRPSAVELVKRLSSLF